jgi:hypothetical protein
MDTNMPEHTRMPAEHEVYDTLIYHKRQAAEMARYMAMYHREDQYDLWMKIAANEDRGADHITKLHGQRVAIALGRPQ